MEMVIAFLLLFEHERPCCTIRYSSVRYRQPGNRKKETGRKLMSRNIGIDTGNAKRIGLYNPYFSKTHSTPGELPAVPVGEPPLCLFFVDNTVFRIKMDQ